MLAVAVAGAVLHKGRMREGDSGLPSREIGNWWRLVCISGALVLASAAALCAVPGVRAADAVVVVEPEPMEYVRICDTYGVGFYYIPGTETCLKVSGYMRFDAGAGAFGLTNVVDKKEPFDFDTFEDNLNDTYDLRARFQLRLDSRAETELGTLRTYAAVNFEWDTGTDHSVL